MLQVFQVLCTENVVMAHNRCNLVIALAAGAGAQQIVESAPAFHAERADAYSNPRNKGYRQVAPRCPLLGFEGKGHGFARCVVK
jgi:hypothetical protein